MTGIRSDGAPALDQSIAPVWTGIHRFANNQNIFSPNSDWALAGVQENPNVLAERFFKVIGAATTSPPSFKGMTYGSTGTRAAPAAAINGDGLVSLDGGGYDTSVFRVQAFIRAFATETWVAGGAHGSYWNIATTQPGVLASRTVVAITQDGHVQLTQDNAELQLGLGTGALPNKTGDLRLYHDGTNSIIRNDTGTLIVYAPSFIESFRSASTGIVVGTGTVGSTSVSVDAANLNTCDFQMKQGALNRWIIRKDGSSETGANAGSNFGIVRRDDTGANLANALIINRATGVWTIGDAAITGTHVMFGGGLSLSNDANAADYVFGISGQAGFNRDIRLRTSGINRWLIRANFTAESGSNAGSDLDIVSRDDAGANIATVMRIFRATGVVAFVGDVRASDSASSATGGVNLADKYSPALLLMGA